MKLTDYITYLEPMKHFRPYWTANLGQTKGTGQTREEATTALFEIMQNSLDGDFTPNMLFHHDYIALIWREGQNWYYTIRKVGESGEVASNIHCIGDRQATEVYARNHLAQYILDEVTHPEEAAEIITDECERTRFISQCYRTKRVQAIMAEQDISWERASMIEDGLTSKS